MEFDAHGSGADLPTDCPNDNVEQNISTPLVMNESAPLHASRQKNVIVSHTTQRVKLLMDAYESNVELRSVPCDPSPISFLWEDLPSRNERPVSRARAQQSTNAGFFGSQNSAALLLDLHHVCREAFAVHGKTFPASIWSCCQKVCFANLAMGGNPRYFSLVKDIHLKAMSLRSSIDEAEAYLRPRCREGTECTRDISRTRPSALADFSSFAKANLPVLLGLESRNGVFGKLCVRATKDALGVSLNFLYKKTNSSNPTEEAFALLDLSGARQRAHRRLGTRIGFVPIESLPEYDCHCPVPCFFGSDIRHLQALFEKFASLSKGFRPYEEENEFLVDFLFEPICNADRRECNEAIAQLFCICSRRVGRARIVVLDLVKNPDFYLRDLRAPEHGMKAYSSQNHPANRISHEMRNAIKHGLDMATRSDPSAADGKVSFRFYDPSVNTYEKVRKLLHQSMSAGLIEQVGGISSTTFQRIFDEYLAERDGRLSLTKADHNCCSICQKLDIAVCALELEVKSLSQRTDDALRKVRIEQLRDAKSNLEEHVGWDRKIRKHLGQIVDYLRSIENVRREARLRVQCDEVDCPTWRSVTDAGLLTHQDEMSKVDIPHFFRETQVDITRYRFDVTAHVSAVTGDAFVFSHEQGTSAKTSGSIFESIMLEHLMTCKGERIKIIWSDCASVGRSFFSCVAATQYFIDSGLCDVFLLGFHANRHGKYLADSLFGQWNRRAANEDMNSIDDLLRVFESVNRSSGAKVRGFALNPVSSIDWIENLKRRGYETSPPPEFGWEAMNPHYACACKKGAKQDLSDELKELIGHLLPDSEHCVRISSWPRFGDPLSSIPFNQRPVDVPAARLKRSTTQDLQNNDEAVLCVPKSRPFQASGDGVVAANTAETVGFNGSGFARKVPKLQVENHLTRRSWPLGFLDTCHKRVTDDRILCAPENWLARSVSQNSKHLSMPGEYIARYPPLNYYNAITRRPPREITRKHKFVETYSEPPFPMIRGTCAYNAAKAMERTNGGQLEASVSVLDLYKAVRTEMGIDRGPTLDAYLQPTAAMAGEDAVRKYKAFLRECKARNRGRPVGKRNAYQLFRADSVAMKDMKRRLITAKKSGNTSATLAYVAKQFWESINIEYKAKYEKQVPFEGDRVAREYVTFLEWQKKHDEERDKRDGLRR